MRRCCSRGNDGGEQALREPADHIDADVSDDQRQQALSLRVDDAEQQRQREVPRRAPQHEGRFGMNVSPACWTLQITAITNTATQARPDNFRTRVRA